MATAEVNRLIDNARIKLPGALDSVLQMELFSVLNDFFQSTNIWEEEIPINVIPTGTSRVTDAASYTYVVVPTDGSIVRLIVIWDTDGSVKSGTMAIPGQLILDYSPDNSTTYTVRVSKTVSDPVNGEGYPVFPNWVLDKYGTVLLDGLLGRMMGQIAKPYSSPQMAQYHMRAFASGTARAFTEATHQNVYRGQSWSFPQTFTRRRFTRI